MSLLHRTIPMGTFGIVIAIVLFNTLWTSGLAVGVQTYHNDSVTLSEELTEFNNEQENVTRKATQNLTSQEEQAFRSVYGVPITSMIDGMFMYATGGMKFGYEHPTLSGVLVRYRLPIILPVVSYLVLRYRTVQRITRFLVGSIK